jgi:hypothetical protein
VREKSKFIKKILGFDFDHDDFGVLVFAFVSLFVLSLLIIHIFMSIVLSTFVSDLSFFYWVIYLILTLLISYMIARLMIRYILKNASKTSNDQPKLIEQASKSTETGIDLGEKTIYWYLFKIPVFVVGIVALTFISILVINDIWPRKRFSPEVDAAFINGFFIFVTIAVTIYFNHKTHKALLTQSRSNMVDRFLNERIKLYPQMDQKNRQLRRILARDPENHERMKQALSDLDEFRHLHRVYISKPIRDKLQQMFDLCLYENEDPILDADHELFTQYSRELTKLIERELDLTAIDEEIRALSK